MDKLIELDVSIDGEDLIPILQEAADRVGLRTKIKNKYQDEDKIKSDGTGFTKKKIYEETEIMLSGKIPFLQSAIIYRVKDGEKSKWFRMAYGWGDMPFPYFGFLPKKKINEFEDVVSYLMAEKYHQFKTVTFM